MAVSKNNFFKDHYDWLVAIVGLALLAGAGILFASSQENSPEAAVEAIKATTPRNPAHKDVPVAATELLDSVTNGLKNPPKIAEQGKTTRGFLTSEPRVFCQVCHLPIPTGSEKCTWKEKCGASQSSEKEDLSHGGDADGDGMTDAWEQKYKLDPRDASDKDKDPDGDTFTNIEEFAAKTDPNDPDSHPDFLDFLSVSNFRTESLPFILTEVRPIRDNYRFVFEPAVTKKRGLGTEYFMGEVAVQKKLDPAPVIGDEIVFLSAKYKEKVKGKMIYGEVKTGWRVLKYNKKEELVLKPGTEQKVRTDVSTAELERISDKRTITIQVGVKKPVAVEEQVDLVWSRGDGKPIAVTKGSKFKLKNREYEVKKLTKEGNGCKVTIMDLKTKEEKIISGT